MKQSPLGHCPVCRGGHTHGVKMKLEPENRAKGGQTDAWGGWQVEGIKSVGSGGVGTGAPLLVGRGGRAAPQEAQWGGWVHSSPTAAVTHYHRLSS